MPGIYIPNQKPQKNFQSPITAELNTEKPPEQKRTVRLDGRLFEIILHNADVEDTAKRLGELFHELCSDEDTATALGRVGVTLGSGEDNAFWMACKELAPTVVSLPTPYGALQVCTDEQDEDEAFRRLGAALSASASKDILEKHQVEVIARR